MAGDASGKYIGRVRRLCLALPESSERRSHGEPTFFVAGRVFAMFANDHHGDGHIAVWVPAPPGMQGTRIEQLPGAFFRPPYVGGAGWIGIELRKALVKDLAFHIELAWELIRAKRRAQPARGNRRLTPTLPRGGAVREAARMERANAERMATWLVRSEREGWSAGELARRCGYPVWKLRWCGTSRAHAPSGLLPVERRTAEEVVGSSTSWHGILHFGSLQVLVGCDAPTSSV